MQYELSRVLKSVTSLQLLCTGSERGIPRAVRRDRAKVIILVTMYVILKNTCAGGSA